MAPDQTPDKNQITFTQEILRKATHMCALVIPGGYYLLGLEKAGMLAIMIPVALLMILIDVSRLRQWLFWRSFARPIVSPMIRQHEKDGDLVLHHGVAGYGYFLHTRRGRSYLCRRYS